MIEFEHDAACIGLRIKAFRSDHAKSWNDVCVDDYGAVWVFDSVAGHFTRFHSMTEAGKKRVRKRWRAAMHDWIGMRPAWMPGQVVGEVRLASLQMQDFNGNWLKALSIDDFMRIREKYFRDIEDARHV